MWWQFNVSTPRKARPSVENLEPYQYHMLRKMIENDRELVLFEGAVRMYKFDKNESNGGMERQHFH